MSDTNDKQSVVTDELRAVARRWDDDMRNGVSDIQGRKLLADSAPALVAEIDHLRQYKQVFAHAVECVDRVFQIDSTRPEPLLPDFCEVGDDKFEAVVRLAKAYIANKCEIDRLRAENQRLYESLPCIDNRTKNRAHELLVGCTTNRDDDGQVSLRLSDVRGVIEDLLTENAKLREQTEELRAKCEDDQWIGRQPPDGPITPVSPQEFVKVLRESGGDAWDKVDNQAELLGDTQPDGPITNDLCRELGCTLVNQCSGDVWQLDVESAYVCDTVDGWTISASPKSKIVLLNGVAMCGGWTANRLRKLVEAMRGE